MTTAKQDPRQPAQAEDARDLQIRLYREIGISAVAAALRFINMPEPGKTEAPVETAAKPRRNLAA